MAELVVDVVAEQVEEEHVADDVQDTAVQKGVGQELPVVPVAGNQNPIDRPGANRQPPELTANEVGVLPLEGVGQEKDDNIDERSGHNWHRASAWARYSSESAAVTASVTVLKKDQPAIPSNHGHILTEPEQNGYHVYVAQVQFYPLGRRTDKAGNRTAALAAVPLMKWVLKEDSQKTHT